eukprot:3416528-Rhodomonas_salina.1
MRRTRWLSASARKRCLPHNQARDRAHKVSFCFVGTRALKRWEGSRSALEILGENDAGGSAEGAAGGFAVVVFGGADADAAVVALVAVGARDAGVGRVAHAPRRCSVRVCSQLMHGHPQPQQQWGWSAQANTGHDTRAAQFRRDRTCLVH